MREEKEIKSFEFLLLVYLYLKISNPIDNHFCCEMPNTTTNLLLTYLWFNVYTLYIWSVFKTKILELLQRG